MWDRCLSKRYGVYSKLRFWLRARWWWRGEFRATVYLWFRVRKQFGRFISSPTARQSCKNSPHDFPSRGLFFTRSPKRPPLSGTGAAAEKDTTTLVFTTTWPSNWTETRDGSSARDFWRGGTTFRSIFRMSTTTTSALGGTLVSAMKVC